MTPIVRHNDKSRLHLARDQVSDRLDADSLGVNAASNTELYGGRTHPSKYPRNLELPKVSSLSFDNDSKMLEISVDVTVLVTPELQRRMNTGIRLSGVSNSWPTLNTHVKSVEAQTTSQWLGVEVRRSGGPLWEKLSLGDIFEGPGRYFPCPGSIDDPCFDSFKEKMRIFYHVSRIHTPRQRASSIERLANQRLDLGRDGVSDWLDA
ncbi:hypothetical protein TNCV_2672241 [Trichonephila clavipes]|nr:hypothetical protein TNCV_2672241 [Trichonephila clavipes]